jgi:hypothetical protein
LLEERKDRRACLDGAAWLLLRIRDIVDAFPLSIRKNSIQKVKTN